MDVLNVWTGNTGPDRELTEPWLLLILATLWNTTISTKTPTTLAHHGIANESPQQHW